MEKKFEKPELEIIVFEEEDIIITSTNDPWGSSGEIGQG